MINIEQWNEFVSRWQEKECYGAEKYLHWKSQIDKFSELADSTGLSSCAGLNILDISTGMGLWPYVLKECGHNVSMTDSISKKTEIYRDAHTVLGLPQVHEHNYVKKQFKPLPDIGCFDVISSLACPPMSFWTFGEWLMFFRDCIKHLNPNGWILLSPNISENTKIIEEVSGAQPIHTSTLKYYKIHMKGQS